MSAGNPYYINTYQNKNIKFKIDSTFNSDTDILVEGVVNSSSTSTGTRDTLQNRAKAWALSRSGEFDPNDPQKGGHVMNLIGNKNIFNADYVSNTVRDLTNNFNKDFAGDASLQYISIKADAKKSARTLELYMIITDIATGKTISMNETVEG